MLLNWLRGVVSSFIAKYGAASVPLDVRAAIDDVSKELDTPIHRKWQVQEGRRSGSNECYQMQGNIYYFLLDA